MRHTAAVFACALCLAASAASNVVAQTHGTISGVITSAVDSSPLSGALIYLQNMKHSAAARCPGRLVVKHL